MSKDTTNTVSGTIGELFGEENYPPPPPKVPFVASDEEVSLQEEDITDFAVLEDIELEDVEGTEWGLPSEEPKKPLVTWLRGIVVIAGVILLIFGGILLVDFYFPKTPEKLYAHQETVKLIANQETAEAKQWRTTVRNETLSKDGEIAPEIGNIMTVNLELSSEPIDLSFTQFDVDYLALPDGVTSTLLVDTSDNANKSAKATLAKRSVHRKKKRVASKKRKGALRSKRGSSRSTTRKKPKKQPSVTRRAPMQIAQVSQKPCEKKLLYACVKKICDQSKKEGDYLTSADCARSCISTNCHRH